MKYAVYTLGCKVNSCESAAIASAFDTKGFEQCKQGEHCGKDAEENYGG